MRIKRNESSIPDAMPTLARGCHRPGEGSGCVMEYISLLAGEEWSDHPSCTHEVLAEVARAVNDRLENGERHRLVPLIGRLFGTTDDRRVVTWGLAEYAARRFNALSAFDPYRVYEVSQVADGMWQVRQDASDQEARYAAARVAFHAANRIDRTGGDPVQFLSDLIDEYDRLTGRTEHRAVSAAELSALALS